MWDREFEIRPLQKYVMIYNSLRLLQSDEGNVKSIMWTNVAHLIEKSIEQIHFGKARIHCQESENYLPSMINY